MKKGKLIVIEGTDCSGKETQSNKLVSRLQQESYKIYKAQFPNYDSATGKIIGGPYLGKEHICESFFEEGATNVNPKVASLYYAADRLYNIDIINKHLNNGEIVILDRYIESNMAHQGGKYNTKEERELMFNFLEKLEYDLLGLPKAEAVIFLHMPYEQACILKQNRDEKPDGHEKDINHLKQAEDTYLELANKYGYQTVECIHNDKTIKTIDEISEEVYKIAKEIIDGR